MGVCCNSIKDDEGNFNYFINEHLKKHSNSISKEKSLKIIEKMDENACEIKKENSKETGFLCIIPVPHEKKPLPVLITCNHILGEKDLKKGDKIIIESNNNEKILKIKNQRKIYIDKIIMI